jgi:hypothetical protein
MTEDWICLVTVEVGPPRMFESNRYEPLDEFIDRVNRKVTEDLISATRIEFQKVEVQ